MSDIKNKVSLDAAQAINEFGKLSRSVTQANAALTDFRINAKGEIESVFDKSADAAGKLAEEAKEAANSTEAAGKAASGLSITWETIGRLAAARAISSAITAIKQGFYESADAAKEFQLQLGRTMAIIDDTELSVDAVSARIKELAVSSGRTLKEANEATFEALQNDLGNAAETFEILNGQAADLALITGGTLTESVNALSSVMKVYGEDSVDAATAAGTMFGAINAGRVTLQELANSLGTVIPLAQRVGVSFEQSANAIATISLAGVDAATAQTQLRNVLSKLIKPTEELKKAFVGLRVEGFEQLVERHGGDFAGALNAISAELGHNEQAIAKAFNTIRGNLGVFNILTQNGDLAARTLQIVRKSAAELSNEIGNIKELDAFKSEQNAAKLNVIFTELGETTLKMKNALEGVFLTFIDDSASAEAAILSFGVAALGTVGYVVAVKKGILGAAAATNALGAAFKGAMPFLGLFAAGTGLGFLAVTKINEMREAASKLQDEMAILEVERLREIAEETKKLNVERVRELGEAFDDVGTAMNSVLEKSRETSKGIMDSFDQVTAHLQSRGENALGAFSDGRQRILDSIASTIRGIDGEILKLTEKISSEQQKLDDQDFKKSLAGLSDMQKATKAMERAYRDVNRAAEAATRSALDKTMRDDTLAIIDAAEASAKYALSLAKTTGNAQAVSRAEANLRIVQQGRINTMISMQRELEQQSKVNMQKELTRLTFLNEEQKKNAAALLERYGELAKSAKEGIISGATLKLEQASIKRELKEIEDAFPEFSASESLARLGYDKLAESVEAQFTDALNNLDIDWTNSINDLHEQLKGAEFEATVKLIAKIDEMAPKELKEKFSEIEAVDPSKALEARAKMIKDLMTETAEQVADIENTDKVIGQKLFEASAKLREASENYTLPATKKALDSTLSNALDALSTLDGKSAEQLVQYRTAILGIIQEVHEKQSSFFTRDSLGIGNAEKIISGMEDAFHAVQLKIESINREPILNDTSDRQLGELIDFLNQSKEQYELKLDTKDISAAHAEMDKVDTSAKNATASTAKIGGAASLSNGHVTILKGTTDQLAQSAHNSANAFWELERAAKAAAAAAAEATSATQHAYNGGLQYRANGGASRGQDTIPTMLSPGEFVVNSRQAAKFLPQLQAINAGNTPAPTSSGGTNITIGDINVNTQSNLPSQTAREVGLSIKRELRRGTLKL